ncbi:hypothetical protein [Methylibium rhizosphaerae]|uniref:hypothetical protein n=1 Tax=Methylibium rhizosphaerae TaxID=2570323 RepID=UPI00112C1520|nr:hypothetical protein [Methylibium rhizosphaerae]
MTINGIRSPASATAAPPLAAVSAGEAGTQAIRTPGLVVGGTADPLERLPHRASEAAVPQPRIALARLGAARPEAGVGALSEAVQALAARVGSEVAGGQVALHGQHSQAVIKAATTVAAVGLLALSKDLFARR